MPLKYTYEVAQLFRNYVNETDATFMSDSIVTSFLETAEERYRHVISDAMPEFFIVTKDYVVSNVTEIDLATVAIPVGTPILGSSVTVSSSNRRLSQLVRVVILDAGSNMPNNILSAAASYEALVTPNYFYPAKYLLQGTKLKFSSSITGTIRLEYIPVTMTDWTKLLSSTTEWIDDAIQWHDLIALFAAEAYAVADNAVSQSVQLLLQKRLADLNAFVTRGRMISANRFVQSENWNS